jgi:hypothetical protein
VCIAYSLRLTCVEDIRGSSALVVLYLLTLSWFALWFAHIRYYRFRKANILVKILSVAQGYFVVALAFAILGTAPSFGSTPACNIHLVAVVFATFRFLNVGRITFLVMLGLVVVVYTALRILECREAWRRPHEAEKHSESQPSVSHEHIRKSSSSLDIATTSYGTLTPLLGDQVDHHLIFKIVLILALSIIGITNTELLIARNHIQIQGRAWGLGPVH